MPYGLEQQLVLLQQSVLDEATMLRPLIPHITLLPPHLLADVPPAALLPVIKQAAAPYLPVTMHISRIGQFKQHTIFAGIESRGLHLLHDMLFRLLPPAARARRDARRPFLPHLTLLQTKRGHSVPPEVTQHIVNQLEPFLPLQFTVHDVLCFEHQGPRRYRPLVV